MVIRRTEVDGVPTLVAPTAGRMRAGLVFRVGQADETLARRGVTHLLEHLVLHPVGMADYHYNGATGNVFTSLHMQGSVEDISTFLAGVCRALRELDTGRLEVEKEILRTEGRSRGPGPLGPMQLWRHGARDHGLISFPEWGLPAVTADDLAAWSARYFTRDNAVLWIAGDDVPAGLRLDLPSGERRAVPAASSALPDTPAYFTGTGGHTGLTAVAPRSPAARAFAGVLDRELYRGLRRRDGLSYTANAGYERRGDGYAVITALADALPDKESAVLGGFVDVLAKAMVGNIDEGDVQAIVAQEVEGLSTPYADARLLAGWATDLLTGYPLRDAAELADRMRAVTIQDVREVASVALGEALLMTPRGRTADWAGFAAAPDASDAAVDGRTYLPLDDATQKHLVVGAAGVSLVGADGRAATVRYDRCAAMLAWPDGGRQLIGDDAISVRIEPTMHRGGHRISVDDRVPARARVDMPPRRPAEIPRPRAAEPSTPPTAKPPPLRTVLRRWTSVAPLALLLVVIGGLALWISTGMMKGRFDPNPMVLALVWVPTWYTAREIVRRWPR